MRDSAVWLAAACGREAGLLIGSYEEAIVNSGLLPVARSGLVSMVCLPFLALALAGPAASGRCQDPEPPAAVQQPAQSAARETWLRLTRERRQLQSQLSAVLTGFSLSNPEAFGKQRQQVEQIKQRLQELKMQQLEAASTAYLEHPVNNFVVERDAITHLRTLLGEDRETVAYDPVRCHQLAAGMLEAGSKSGWVFRLAVRAAIAMEDFAAARKHADDLVASGGEIVGSFDDRLSQIERNWQVEKAARERDAQAQLPIVRIETDAGIMLVELFEDDAPNTVANFISLAESGFYVDSDFYSVQPGLISLGGCPLGNGTGDAGYFIPSEADAPTARKHFAGSLATYHPPGKPDSSQFGITWQPFPERDGSFTVFGRIVEGLDVLFRMPAFSASDRLAKTQPIKVRAIRVVQKRDHVYKPSKIGDQPGEAIQPPAGEEHAAPGGSTGDGGLAPAVPEPAETPGGGGGS